MVIDYYSFTIIKIDLDWDRAHTVLKPVSIPLLYSEQDM